MDGIETSAVPAFARFDALLAASLEGIVLVPVGLEAPGDDGPVFASSLPTVIKLAKAQGVPMTIYGAPSPPLLLERRSSEWFAPAMFISSLYMTENPNAVALALSMLANYLTTLFAGRESASVSLDVYVADDGTRATTKVSYRGPVGGIRDVQGAIEAAHRKKGR